jgi:hypothetical protein
LFSSISDFERKRNYAKDKLIKIKKIFFFVSASSFGGKRNALKMKNNNIVSKLW